MDSQSSCSTSQQEEKTTYFNSATSSLNSSSELQEASSDDSNESSSSRHSVNSENQSLNNHNQHYTSHQQRQHQQQYGLMSIRTQNDGRKIANTPMYSKITNNRSDSTDEYYPQTRNSFVLENQSQQISHSTQQQYPVYHQSSLEPYFNYPNSQVNDNNTFSSITINEQQQEASVSKDTAHQNQLSSNIILEKFVSPIQSHSIRAIKTSDFVNNLKAPIRTQHIHANYDQHPYMPISLMSNPSPYFSTTVVSSPSHNNNAPMTISTSSVTIPGQLKSSNQQSQMNDPYYINDSDVNSRKHYEEKKLKTQRTYCPLKPYPPKYESKLSLVTKINHPVTTQMMQSQALSESFSQLSAIVSNDNLQYNLNNIGSFPSSNTSISVTSSSLNTSITNSAPLQQMNLSNTSNLPILFQNTSNTIRNSFPPTTSFDIWLLDMIRSNSPQYPKHVTYNSDDQSQIGKTLDTNINDNIEYIFFPNGASHHSNSSADFLYSTSQKNFPITTISSPEINSLATNYNMTQDITKRDSSEINASDFDVFSNASDSSANIHYHHNKQVSSTSTNHVDNNSIDKHDEDVNSFGTSGMTTLSFSGSRNASFQHPGVDRCRTLKKPKRGRPRKNLN